MAAGAALIDEYTGDSWQMRAGRTSVESVEDRIEGLTRGNLGPPYQETFAYALANGTDEIEYVYCTLDENVRLIRVS